MQPDLDLVVHYILNQPLGVFDLLQQLPDSHDSLFLMTDIIHAISTSGNVIGNAVLIRNAVAMHIVVSSPLKCRFKITPMIIVDKKTQRRYIASMCCF